MKDPAFLFYPNDYLGGTLGMTFEEKGAYIEILMLQFNRGHMTYHMIGQVLGQSMDKIWPVISSKFKTDDHGNYFNERLKIEQEKRKSYTESRKNNIQGINQFTKYKENQPKKIGHMTTHMTGHMENRNRNENEDINLSENKVDFSFFWNLYNKKVGDKNRCKKKWDKLNIDIQEKILETLPDFIKQFSDKQYCPHPETYINQERWNDEIIINTNINGKDKRSIKEGTSWEQLAEIAKRASEKIAI